MAVINEEEINKIRQSVNIVDIIKSYIPVSLKGKDYKCICPFHDDHSPSMSISTSKQIYKCFSCGAAGNVFTFVENYENVSFIEAVRIVAAKSGYNIDIPTNIKKETKYQKEYELFDLINKYFENNINTKKGSLAKEYLLKRGLTEDNIKEFRIGVCGDEQNTLTNFLLKKGYDKDLLISLGITGENESILYDVFRGRITFPLMDEYNNILGYSARIYRNESLAKYVNTKETPIFIKGNFLYNYNRAKEVAKRSGSLLIVEGQMDCIRVYINGIKNVIALMGTALTTNQINMIKRLRCKVILGLDGDSAGEMATTKNGDLLTLNDIEVKVLRISSAKDPDEYILKYGVDSYKESLDKAIDFFDFKLNALKNISEDNTIEFTSMINTLLKDIKSYKDSLIREVYLQKLSNASNINIEILKARINEITELKTIAKETFNKKEVKDSIDILDKITEKVLYYMMNDYTYINTYQEEIGMFMKKKYRDIANEIVYFYEKNGIINIADFISYMGDKENNDLVLKIASDKEDIDEKNFSLVIKSYKKEKAREDINALQEKLKQSVDYETQISIVNKIKEIKKGSVL